MRRISTLTGLLLISTIVTLAGCGPTSSAPPTTAPPTIAPPTTAPPTDIPPTDIPPTDSPPTDSPPTDSPPTDSPPTDSPPTIAPPPTVFFDNLPPPALCPGDNPTLTAVTDIAPNLDTRTNAALGPGVISADIRYTNKNNQNFMLTVSGRDSGTVRTFALGLQICFEAVPFGGVGAAPLKGIEVIERGKSEGDLPFSETVPFTKTILFDLGDSSFLVEMEWLDAKNQPAEGRNVAIFYAIDPPIDRNHWDGYVAKCQKLGWARIRASDRSATLHIWLAYPYKFGDKRTANAAVPASNPTPWIGTTTPTATTYNVGVQGGPDGGIYTIEGGWVQGVGGGCR